MLKRTSVIILGLFLLAGGGLWLYGQQAQDAVGMLQADPGVVVVNTPTQVTFSIPISGTTLIPTSVTLLRVSSDDTRTVAGSLRDNGVAGDVAADDGIYSTTLSLNEFDVGTFAYQASIAFRRQLRRTLSEPMQFAVLAPTSIPVVLPPDPGEAGKQTLAGIDLDGDGVRDDVQRFIVFQNPDSERLRAAWHQYARYDQQLILSSTDPSQAIQIARDQIESIGCVYSFAGFSPSSSAARDDLVAASLNTPARTRAYFDSDRHLSGEVFYTPNFDTVGANCLFDFTPMEN